MIHQSCGGAVSRRRATVLPNYRWIGAKGIRRWLAVQAVHRSERGSEMSSSATQVTELLLRWGRGDEAARELLIPAVYEELRRLARHHMRRERPNHTL